METITNITDIISKNNIVNTAYDYAVADEIYYSIPIFGIGIFISILLISILVKKHRWLLIILGSVTLICSLVYGTVYSMNNMELVSTTYTFRASSTRTIEKVEKYIGVVTYNEIRDLYTVTQYSRKD